VVIADDLDGSPGARAMAVSFDSCGYQIDRGKKNRRGSASRRSR
jgi:hypothetical protein